MSEVAQIDLDSDFVPQLIVPRGSRPKRVQQIPLGPRRSA
jgi:hypothetical protein